MATMVARLYIIVGALIMAATLTSVGAAISFLPWRHNRLSFTINHSFNRRCNISIPRCGHSDNVDNAVGYAEKESAVSQKISDQPPAKSLGVDMEDAHTTTVDDNDAISEAAEEDEARSSHDLMIDDGGSPMGSESSVKSENEGASTNTIPSEEDGAWGEEIRRTRAFYNTPIAGSTANNVSENVEDEELTTTEDERVFGNAQTTTYNVMEKEGIEENTMESKQQQLEEAETNRNDSDQNDGIEERQSLNEQSRPEPISEGVPTSSQDYATAGVPIDTAGIIEDEEVDVQVSLDISSQEDENKMPPNKDDKQLPAEEKDVDQEQVVTSEESSNNFHAEIKDTVADESEMVSPVQEEKDVDDGEVKTEESSTDNEAKDSVTNESDVDQEEVVTSEESSNNVHAEIKDTVADESEMVFPVQEEKDVDDGEVVMEKSSADNEANDSVTNASGEEQLQSVAADIKDSHLEDLIADTHGREISPISNIGLEMEDLPVVPTWQKAANDIEPVIAIEEGREKKSLKGAVVSLFQRLQKKVSIALAGRDPQSTIKSLLVASVGVALSILLSSNHKKSWEGTAATSEFPSSIEVPSDNIESELSDVEEDLYELDDTPSAPELHPDDLDKT